MRKVFLDDLPRGGTHIKSSDINWKKCIGIKTKFIYDDIEGWMEIIDYNRNKKDYLTIKYNNRNYQIKANNFSKCKLRIILGIKTSNFKIEIGQTFKDDKRDLVITDRKKIKNKHGQLCKCYKYKCNICGFECGEHYKNGEYKEELWTVESNLQQKNQGCSCCNNVAIVKNINSTFSTHPRLIQYFKYLEDSKKYTYSSFRRINCICPDCGREKEITLNRLYNKGLGCVCGDKKSYPEKFTMFALEQLNVNFKIEYSPDWIKPKRYDFYFKYNNEKHIIETHGMQHYEGGFDAYGGKTLEEEQANDKFKRQLALDNGIREENYIVIDCRKSELEWVRNNILNSRLNELFDLSKIDWNKCEEFALSNLVKKACEYKRNNPELTCGEIAEIMKIGVSTITTWLKRGSKIWDWCTYDSKEEQTKAWIKGKQVEILKNGVSLGIFPSCVALVKCIKKDFGIILDRNIISSVCNNKREIYKGFTFKFVENTSTRIYKLETEQAS